MDYTLPRLKRELSQAAQRLLGVDKVEVIDAKPQFGADLAVPVFSLAARLSQPLPDIAARLAGELKHDWVERVEASGGYVNVWLKAEQLAKAVIDDTNRADFGQNHDRGGQTVLVEHTDPNPFKELHIGHLYSNTVGEAICRLFEASGAKVHRLSYHGDVGLHIAKAIFGMQRLQAARQQPLDTLPYEERAGFLAQAYADGAKAHEEDEAVRLQIAEINKKIYDRSDPAINEFYDWGRQASFAYFDEIYTRFQAPAFEKQYFESEAGLAGLALVRANIGQFEESESAVVFRGEQDGQHTRVFITKEGLPTYESKELGLATLKDRDFPQASLSVVVTANEINAYFRVVLAALKRIKSELADKTRHLSHGVVRLPSGKMSSRSGDVVRAVDLLDEVTTAVKALAPDSPSAEDNALAAIKYAFLRPSVGGDIVYSVKESIKLEGQTGPYIQYAAVRINSILEKVESTADEDGGYDWQAEKPLLIQIARYPEVVQAASAELAPNDLANYAYELAKIFNRYYETTPVKDAPGGIRGVRLAVLRATRTTLGSSLNLLNIPLPRKM
jgi:arginyl-tRNA synthetase